MEADGALFPPVSLSAPFYEYLNLKLFMDQRKVETDVEVPRDRVGDLLL